MSITGLCQICEAAPARHTCPLCGRAVCDAHWDAEAGVCTECAAGRR